MWVPAVVAILAASILVRMPPRESSDAAQRPPCLRSSRVMRSTTGMRFAATPAPGERVVKPVNIGQQHEQVCAHHGGNARCEAIVVAVTDFAGCDGVVFVDHRYRAPFQQAGDGGARVEIALALLSIGQCNQNLPSADAVTAQRFRPCTREFNLSDRCRRLTVIELEQAPSAA